MFSIPDIQSIYSLYQIYRGIYSLYQIYRGVYSQYKVCRGIYSLYQIYRDILFIFSRSITSALSYQYHYYCYSLECGSLPGLPVRPAVGKYLNTTPSIGLGGHSGVYGGLHGGPQEAYGGIQHDYGGFLGNHGGVFGGLMGDQPGEVESGMARGQQSNNF